MLPNRDQFGCLKHRVKHPLPKVPFATGWLATGTNSPHAVLLTSLAPSRYTPHYACILSHYSRYARTSQVVLNQPQNTESVDTKFTDPTNHSKNQTQILLNRYNPYNLYFRKVSKKKEKILTCGGGRRRPEGPAAAAGGGPERQAAAAAGGGPERPAAAAAGGGPGRPAPPLQDREPNV